MACTPLKLVHWDSNVAEHGFRSPYSDTGSSQSQNSTSTVQYVNAQLIAHGFTQAPGLSTDGLSKADEERLVKCILAMLSQRMEDMSRAEDFSSKMRTLSYENERLSSMHNACMEQLTTAEKNTNLFKSRLNTSLKSLQSAQTSHKLTSSELQRTRTTLQSVRQTHAAELKRREKESERMVERWAKLAESQLKIAAISSGVAFHPAYARAQPNMNFWANEAVATKDGEVVGKGSGLLEAALEDAEQARKGLEEENRRVKITVVECANQLARMLNTVRARSGKSGEEAPIYSVQSMFPIANANLASAQFESLVETLRESVLEICGTKDEEDSPSPSPIALPRLAARTSSADSKREADKIGIDIERENRKLQDVVDGLRKDIEQVSKRSGEYSGKVSTLFQKANDEEDKEAAESHYKRQTATPPYMEEDDINAYIPPDEPSNLSPPRQRRKSVKFRSPKPHHSPIRTKALIPATSGSPKGIRSPRRGVRKSVAQMLNSSGMLGSKRVVPAFETEVVPPLFASSRGAGPSNRLVTSTFVLPPPSPMASLPQRDDLLASFAPAAASRLDRDRAAEKDLFDNATIEDPSFDSDTDTAAAATQSTTPPTPPAQVRVQQRGGRKSFNFPVAKPFAKGMIHAYSPARPSPLSRILLLSESPDSLSGSGPVLENVLEDAGEWMDEEELKENDVMRHCRTNSGDDCGDEESPLREKASKQAKQATEIHSKSRSSAASARCSSKDKPAKSIKEKLMDTRGTNVAVSSSKGKGKGKAGGVSSSTNQNAPSSKEKESRKESKRPTSATGHHVDGSAPVNTRDSNRARPSDETSKPMRRSRSKSRLSPTLIAQPDPGHGWDSAAGTGVQDEPEAKRTQSRKVSGSSASNADGKPMGGLGTLKGMTGGARRVPIGSADAGPVGPGWR